MKQGNIQHVLKSVLRWLFCWVPLALLTGVVSSPLLLIFDQSIALDDVASVTLFVSLMVLVINILFRLWEYAFDKSVRLVAILSCIIPPVLFVGLLFFSFGWH